jgi:hypothetical protein
MNAEWSHSFGAFTSRLGVFMPPPSLHNPRRIAMQLPKLWLLSRGAVVILLTLVLVLPVLSGQAWAAKDDDESGPTQLVRGAASLLVGIPYTAIKLGYAGLGAVLGSVTFVITGGNGEAAQKVWDSSLRGTYIITPDHLKGEKPIKFIGSSKEDRKLAAAQEEEDRFES